MTGLTDVVVLLVGQVYEKLKEPLPTIVSALVRCGPGSKLLPILIDVLTTSPRRSCIDSSRNMTYKHQGFVHSSSLWCRLWDRSPS